MNKIKKHVTTLSRDVTALQKTNARREKLKELREHPGVLSITVPETPVRPAFETTVKRPVNERDDLYVIFDADVIDRIIAGVVSATACRASSPAAPSG